MISGIICSFVEIKVAIKDFSPDKYFLPWVKIDLENLVGWIFAYDMETCHLLVNSLGDVVFLLLKCLLFLHEISKWSCVHFSWIDGKLLIVGLVRLLSSYALVSFFNFVKLFLVFSSSLLLFILLMPEVDFLFVHRF